MKKLILILLVALSAATSFAAASPEKDGPFPKFASGIWVSPQSSRTVYVQVSAPRDGQVFLFVILKNSQGVTVAQGGGMVAADATVAEVAMLYASGQTVALKIQVMDDEKNSSDSPHLKVMVHGVGAVYSRVK